MSPSDTLRMVGEALYGSRWQSDLAADLNVSDRTMRRWVAGSELPRVDVVKDLGTLVQKRTGRLGEVGTALTHVQLIQWRATGPKVPRGEERENESRPVYAEVEDMDDA